MSALKGGLLLIPSAVAAAMSVWQIQRMQWKVSGSVQLRTHNPFYVKVHNRKSTAEF